MCLINIALLNNLNLTAKMIARSQIQLDNWYRYMTSTQLNSNLLILCHRE